MRIAYENNIDDIATTSFTALTAAVGFPIENVKEQRLSVEYRSTSVTAQTIVINLGAAHSITTAAILGHNLTSSASIIVAFNSVDSWASPPVTETLTYNADVILKFFTSHNYQYVRFYINDTTNTDGYISIGRLWLGDYITITPSSLLDFSVTKMRSDNVIHGRGRQKYASIGIGWRLFSFTFPPTKNAVLILLQSMIDYVGRHSSFIFCNFDTDRTYTLVEPCYCSLTEDIVFSHDTGMKFTYEMIFEEEK